MDSPCKQPLQRLIDKNQQILPREVSSAIETIAALIEAKGSTELRGELGALRHELKSLEGISLADAIRRAEGGTGAAKYGVLPIIRTNALGSASKNQILSDFGSRLSVDREPPERPPRLFVKVLADKLQSAVHETLARIKPGRLLSFVEQIGQLLE